MLFVLGHTFAKLRSFFVFAIIIAKLRVNMSAFCVQNFLLLCFVFCTTGYVQINAKLKGDILSALTMDIPDELLDIIIDMSFEAETEYIAHV